jgi:AcrR family transcriptional regulator
MSRDADEKHSEGPAAKAVRQARQDVEREVKRAAGDVKREARRAAHQVAHEARRAAVEAAREARRTAREDGSGPIWLRPEPGSRRPRFTREEIAQVALSIADAEGIEAVSMRRVAGELGAGTMSLYHYVQSKDELLELMHDAMIGEVLVSEGELQGDWRRALTAIAMRGFATFAQHPWAIEAPPTAPGPNAMRHIDQSLAAVAELDVDLRTRFEIITMVDDYLVGFVLRAAEDERELQSYGENFHDTIADYFADQLATGEYPHIKAAIGERPVRDVIAELNELSSDEGRFERGLARVLDGIARSLGIE